MSNNGVGFFVDSEGVYRGQLDKNYGLQQGWQLIPTSPLDARQKWSFEQEVWAAVGTSYEEELAVLSSDYQKDVDAFNRAWATALLADGPNEAAKLAAIRTQYLTRKDQYSADYAALRNKYQK